VARLPPTLAQRLAPEPGDHPNDIHCRGGEELLEGRAREAKIPTLAKIKASYPLRETALNSHTQGILCGERRCLLALPRRLERLVVGLQPDGELAWGSSRRGTRLAGGARVTRGPVEPEADDRVARDIMSRPPIDARMALGTVRLLGVPIDDTGLQVIALVRPSLPAIGPKGRPDDIDLVPGLGGDQIQRAPATG
jgi:hypothetical protein